VSGNQNSYVTFPKLFHVLSEVPQVLTQQANNLVILKNKTWLVFLSDKREKSEGDKEEE
jgi:hypothetical protein